MAKFYIVYASSHLLNFDPFLKDEEHVPAYVYDLCLLSIRACVLYVPSAFCRVAQVLFMHSWNLFFSTCFYLIGFF